MRRSTGRTVFGISLAATAVFASSCRKNPVGGTSPIAGDGKPVIYTTFYPTKYFAERIGGDSVNVVCPVPEGEDVIFWMPDRKVLLGYQKADLVILNGAGLAKWVGKVSLAQARVVNTSSPIKDELLRYEDVGTHSHGPTGKHEHKGFDGHTWVDPVMAKVQAGEIARAMKKRFPKHAAEFETGWKALAKDLDDLHGEFTTLTRTYKGRPILASHPAYNYIARRYKWNLTNLNLSPEKMPSDETFDGIKALLATTPARHILWETAPTAPIAARFRTDLGLKSVVFSPCELLSEADIKRGLDYLAVMKSNIKNIREALAP